MKAPLTFYPRHVSVFGNMISKDLTPSLECDIERPDPVTGIDRIVVILKGSQYAN